MHLFWRPDRTLEKLITKKILNKFPKEVAQTITEQRFDIKNTHFKQKKVCDYTILKNL